MIAQDFITISPLIAAVLTAAAVLVVDLIRPGRSGPAVATALIGLALTAVITLSVGGTEATAFGGSYTVDALTTFLDILFIAVIVMTILFAPDYLLPRSLPVAEFATVLIFAMSGAMLLAGSTDLLLLFLGLELMVLPGLPPRRLPQDRRLLDRGRDQVLPARLVQLGDLPVRAGLRLGPDRDDARGRSGRHRGQARGDRRRARRRCRRAWRWASRS